MHLKLYKHHTECWKLCKSRLQMCYRKEELITIQWWGSKNLEKEVGEGGVGQNPVSFMCKVTTDVNFW